MSQPEIFTLSLQLANGVPEFDNPVSVFSDKELIGFARVYKEDNVYMSELILDYAIPERLDIENGNKYTISTHYNGSKIEYFTIKIGG